MKPSEDGQFDRPLHSDDASSNRTAAGSIFSREWAIASLFLFLGFQANASPSPASPQKVVELKPGEFTEQLWLKDAPAFTHFSARGVVAYGGISAHFLLPRRFCLFSDPSRNPSGNRGYEPMSALEAWELPNAECYPVQVRDMDSPSLSGITVIGVQSRELPWRVMKAMWDGDAVVIRGCRGNAIVSEVYFENVEDGFGPQSQLDSWILEGAYMRYIRDDAIENDDLIPGTIKNCLIDGCFVFLSQRPDEVQTTNAITTVEDCVVHVEAQPHDGFEGRQWRDQYVRIGTDGIGRSPGMPFKWAEGCGSLHLSRTVIRMDAMSASGPNDMRFPPGVYSDVTLVWTGDGDYPVPIPEGVHLTRDINVWDRARALWIRRMPPDHPAASILASDVKSERTSSTVSKSDSQGAAPAKPNQG